MKQRNKKGFTLVELVIVIVVIAILAAVLIPTFASLIKQAKLSADQRLIGEMNLALEAEEVDGTKPKDMDEVKAILILAGFRVPTEATTEEHQYYWIKEDNRVVLVRMEGETPKEIVYPSDLAEKYKTELPSEWYTLKGEPCKHEGERKIEPLIINEESYYHKIICTICNQIIDVELHDKEGTAGRCSKCDYMTTLVIPADCNHKKADGEFDFSYVALALDTGGSEYHSVICNICRKVITDKAPHQYAQNEAGKVACKDCGFIRATSAEGCSHAMYTYTPNKDGTHTKTCGICGESWKEDCLYVVIKDEKTGEEKICCTYCGYEYPKTEHVHTYTYKSNGDDTHDRSCTDPHCDDKEAANVRNIQCSYGEVKQEADGTQYRECIYCGFKKKEFKDGLVDGFYYKNDQLYTGTDGGYEYEYGKLVLTGAKTTVKENSFQWDFTLEGDDGHITDNIVLKFKDLEDKQQPGDSTKNHVKLTGFDNYTVKSVALAPSVNMTAAIDMLQEAVDSGKTEGILDLIDEVFGLDNTFYPYVTESKRYNNWGKSGSYVDYIKGFYSVDHLYELLSEDHWLDVVQAAAFWTYPAWPRGTTEDGLFQGNIVLSRYINYFSDGGIEIENEEGKLEGRVRYKNPEYVLLFWKVAYEHAYFGVISYPESQSLGSNFYDTYYGIDWKEKLGEAKNCKVLSTLELFDGVALEDKKDFLVFSAAHSYLMNNACQSMATPTQDFKIMLERKKSESN